MTFFTYCWVIVDPPPALALPVTCPQAARKKPDTEKPLLSQKSRSSAASTAFDTYSGRSSKDTNVRLPSGGTKRASSVVPSEA